MPEIWQNYISIIGDLRDDREDLLICQTKNHCTGQETQ